MDYDTVYPTSNTPATFSPNGPPAALPDNVLRRIFDLYIQGPLVFPPPTDEHRWVLTRVCAGWRLVVVSTPSYWTAYDFIQREIQHPNNFVHLAESFFVRSGNTLPLALGFRGSFRFQSTLGRNIFNLVVRPRAHRVWFLSCCVTKSDLRTFFGPGHVHFLFLQAIDVAVIGNSAASGVVAPQIPVKGSIDLSVFQCAPLLRQVSLRILDGVHPMDLHLPWGRLTRIDLGQTSIHVPTFIHIMEQSLLLEDGVFYVDFFRLYDMQPTTLRKISIPRLRQLRIRLVRPSRDTRIFSKLEMPSLNELWVEREELGHAIRDTTIYEPLLANLSATLKSLTISEHSIPQSNCYIPRLNWSSRLAYQDVDGALRTSQNLTSLSLCPGVFVNPLVLNKLASGEYLPFLEKLEVSSVKGWDIILMVERKNFKFALTFPECGSSSESAATHPVALKYLSLFVIGYGSNESEERKLDDAALALCLVYGYAIRYMDIPKRESLSLHW
jgi:hypothetical protein